MKPFLFLIMGLCILSFVVAYQIILVDDINTYGLFVNGFIEESLGTQEKHIPNSYTLKAYNVTDNNYSTWTSFNDNYLNYTILPSQPVYLNYSMEYCSMCFMNIYGWNYDINDWAVILTGTESINSSVPINNSFIRDMNVRLRFIAVPNLGVYPKMFEFFLTFPNETISSGFNQGHRMTMTNFNLDSGVFYIGGDPTTTTYYGNVSLSSCLSSFSVKPPAGNSTGIFPTGQNITGCSFNVTNLEPNPIVFYMRYDGSLGYYHNIFLDTFQTLRPHSRTESNWINDSLYNITYWVNETHQLTYEGQYNLSRLCFQGVIINYSLVMLYNFNNSADAIVDIIGNQSFDNDTNITTIGPTQINTTFGCDSHNSISFNTTRTNYSTYDEAVLDYRLNKDSFPIWFRLNISDGSTDVLSPYTLVDNQNTSVLRLDITSLNNITRYTLEFNGTTKGAVTFNDLILNDTDVEQKINFYVGNGTYANSVNLTSAHKEIFTIQPYGTMPLKFYFDFFYPLMGTTLSLGNLKYQTVVIT